MNNREIQEINKYCSPDSFLIVTYKGDLIRLFCPFDVLVMVKIDSYVPGDKVKVSAVKMDSNFILIYIIKGIGYYYYNFLILIG
jgi:hypothetical protein